MKYLSILYLSTLIIMSVFDFLWIGVLAREFYKRNIGPELDFQLIPAILFYLMYTAGILIFVSNSAIATNWKSVALYGAMLGFVAYATYDFTNMATLKGWSWPVVWVDIAWGVFNTAVAGSAGWLIAQYFNQQP